MGSLRIGNLLVPNDNYCKFEDWLMPILERMVDEQDTQVRAGDPNLGPLSPGTGSWGSLDTLGPPWLGFLSQVPTGPAVDAVPDDRPAGQGDQQPRVHLLLGPEGTGGTGGAPGGVTEGASS